MPTLENISELDVKSGKLEMAVGSFVDRIMVSGGTLCLYHLGDIYFMENFSGGGNLILGEYQTLVLLGNVTGSTKVYIGDITSHLYRLKDFRLHHAMDINR